MASRIPHDEDHIFTDPCGDAPREVVEEDLTPGASRPEGMSQEKYLFSLRRSALRLARRDLLAFTMWTKPDYEVNWHHQYMADRLTRFADGEILRLILCIPPRRGKSELASRRLPAFILGRNPDAEILFGSYASSLAGDMSMDAKQIMDDESYSEVFPGVRLARAGKDPNQRSTQTEWQVAGRHGKYKAQGVGGAFTGRGGDFLILDDPYKNAEEAHSETYREKVWSWYTKVFRSRRAPKAGILIIMNRWHMDDLVGRLLAEQREKPGVADEWEVVEIRERREEEDLPWDPRQVGEALWPSKYPISEIESDMSHDEDGAWALMQQQPVPAGGNIIKSDWIKTYYRDVAPSAPGLWVMSMDLRGSSKSKRSSFAVIQVWWRAHGFADVYLIDQVRGRWDTPETIQSILRMAHKWPRAVGKRVEDAAEGRPIVNMLRKGVPGLVLVRPEGTKETRLRATTPLWQAGNIWIPDVKRFPWVREFVHEHVSFPGSTYNDQVDATGYGLRVYLDAPITAAVPLALVEKMGSRRMRGWIG